MPFYETLVDNAYSNNPQISLSSFFGAGESTHNMHPTCFTALLCQGRFCGKAPDCLWIVGPFAVHCLETKYRHYSSVNLFIFNNGLQFKI